MGSNSHIGRLSPQAAGRPRERLQRYLAARCANPKALARAAAISPKAAENALAGHWPNDLTLAAIVRAFGRDVWDAVLLPETEPILANLLQRERDLDEALEAARAQRRRIEGRHTHRREERVALAREGLK